MQSNVILSVFIQHFNCSKIEKPNIVIDTRLSQVAT